MLCGSSEVYCIDPFWRLTSRGRFHRQLAEKDGELVTKARAAADLKVPFPLS